ncbi:MAG: glycerophosphodiester phosphodiesterase [Sphaerochaetaceae bacterium]|nr:glycerophosphodiester phosphodiesterase [Sphaerochaetaceae bacterium]
MNIFAHRGSSGHYPENTMTAFRKAQEAGSYGIELDVQLTKDGEVVIIHDEKVDRTTDGSGFVLDHSLKELRRLNASKNDFETVPTFNEYCEWAAETHIVTNIELKSSVIYYKGLEQKTLDIIGRYGLEKSVILSSFNHMSLMEVQRLAPTVETAALVANPGLRFGGNFCSKYGFTYFHPEFESIDEDTIEECLENGIGVNTWTVNTEKQLQRTLDLGVAGIFTNYPLMCIEYLGGN